jgi:hypothetical protein
MMLETAKGYTMINKVRMAFEAALEVCRVYTQGEVEIPEQDLAIIAKYVRLGVIEFTPKKQKVSTGIYYPLIQNVVFDGLMKETFLKVVRKAMAVHNIESNLSINSVNTYVSSPYKYGIEPVRLITAQALGGKHSSMYIEEVNAWKQVKEEYENGMV